MPYLMDCAGKMHEVNFLNSLIKRTKGWRYISQLEYCNYKIAEMRKAREQSGNIDYASFVVINTSKLNNIIHW